MENYYGIDSSGNLYHWGVKGMKWGVRRYQNKDGSLTPAGKKRVKENTTAKTVDDVWTERDSRAGRSLAKLAGKTEAEVSERDRGTFSADIRNLLTQTRPENISSKNADDVKETGKFLKDCWEYEIRVANSEFASGIPVRVGGTPLHEVVNKYYNTYVKNNPDAYAKSIIEEIERRELEHSGVSTTSTNGELYHWGIKGMKWGQRRYQNKDGSLTPAGKKRYAKEEADLKEREKAIKNRERESAKRAKLDAKKAELDAREKALNGEGKTTTSKSTPAKQKSVTDMTDDELRTAIARKQLENMYTQYHPQPKPSESFGKKLIDDAVKPAAINAGKKFVESALNKVAGDILKDKVDPNSLEALKKTYEKLDYKHKIDKLQNPDKYLSEEDKTKRQDRENKAEDRAARKEGYLDAADKAVKTREAEEAARKAKADSEARTANESKSKEYYDSIYNKAGGEKYYVNPNESRELAVYNSPVSNLPSTSVSSGKRYVNDSPIIRDEYVVLVDEDGTTTIVRRDDL